jgi:hypothetical protein
MVCRNICLRSYSKMVVGQSHYSVGKKYCRRCECYFVTPQMFCECCGMRLRASPHCGRVYREKVRAKKNQLIDHKRVYHRKYGIMRLPHVCLHDSELQKRYGMSARSNYSAFTLSLYCTDQNFENKLNQDSVNFVKLLIYSAYILLQVLT